MYMRTITQKLFHTLRTRDLHLYFNEYRIPTANEHRPSYQHSTTDSYDKKRINKENPVRKEILS